MKTIAGVILAFGSAAFFAVGYTVQHRAVGKLEALRVRHPIESARHLLASRSWLLANLANWLGWGGFVGALALAPLSIVQSVSAGATGLFVLLVRSSRKPTNLQRAFALTAAAGLALVLSSDADYGSSAHFSHGAAWLVVGCVLAGGAVVTVATPRRRRGVALALSSGLFYGAGDIAMKGTLGGELSLLLAVALCAATGFVVLQISYQHSSLIVSAGLSNLATNVTPIVAGLLLFGEAPHGAGALWVRGMGVAAVVVAAVGLAIEGAGPDDVTPSGQPPRSTVAT